MRRVGSDAGERHLVGSEGSFYRQPILLFWTRPTFWRPQYDGGPTRSIIARASVSCSFLNSAYRSVTSIECCGKCLMDVMRFRTLHEMHVVPVSLDDAAEVFIACTAGHCGAANFIAIQVQNRQDRAITRRVQKRRAFPRARKRTCLCFAVANDSSHEQVWIIEGRAECMGKHVTELTAFMD